MVRGGPDFCSERQILSGPIADPPERNFQAVSARVVRGMQTKRFRPIIAEDQVSVVFDDARVREFAKDIPLPQGADIAVLAAGLREAARIYVREACIPTDNDLHDEIAALWKAADGRQYEQAALLRERLSPRAREFLDGRTDRIALAQARKTNGSRAVAIGRNGQVLTRQPRMPLTIALPTPRDLRDEASRDRACEDAARLCSFGVEFDEGRLRPSGKRSRPVLKRLLFAPEPQKNFPKRVAERNFVMGLSIAWLEATGTAPPRTARHADDSRDIGPFARFARECLRLVGAKGVNVVNLINSINWRRLQMDQSPIKGASK
jgi:hypothetical protein